MLRAINPLQTSTLAKKDGQTVHFAKQGLAGEIEQTSRPDGLQHEAAS
jgi:hypothetical protein